jgi:type IV pilus assembly protein PilP
MHPCFPEYRRRRSLVAVRRLVAGTATAALLAACGAGSNQTELTQELANLTRDARGRVDALPRMAPYEPPDYGARELTDPFSEKRITESNRVESAASATGAALLAAQKNRPRQPLEAFALETMKLVGSVSIKGQPHALIRLDQSIYRVKVGDYMGQNMGRVVAISADEVSLRELVQDGAGAWSERESTLTLQDTEGSKR